MALKSLFSQELTYLAHTTVWQPHSLLPSLGFLAPAFLPFPEDPAHLSELRAACVLCGECLIPLQVQTPHAGTKAF